MTSVRINDDFVHDLMVCAHGDNPYFLACVESLVRQKAARCRVVICTAKITERMASIAADYGLLIELDPTATSMAANWNHALRKSRARYVTVCHQDDLYSPEYSMRMVECMERHPDAIIGLCGSSELTSEGIRFFGLNLAVKRTLHFLAFGFGSVRSTRLARRPLLAFGNPVCCPGVVFRRERIDGFSFDERLKSNLDWDAWERITRLQGAIAYVRENLVSHRIHADSATTALIANRVRSQEDLAMFSRFWSGRMARFISWLYCLGYLGNKG